MQATSKSNMHTSLVSAATWRPDSGVCSANFITTQLPAANDGPSFQACINNGKFHWINNKNMCGKIYICNLPVIDTCYMPLSNYILFCRF